MSQQGYLMKKNFIKQSLSLIALLLVLLPGCKHQFADLNLIDDAAKCYISISVENQDFSARSGSNLSWNTVESIKLLANNQELKTWSSTDDTTAYEVLQADAILPITAGTYSFEIQLLDASNIILAKGEIPNKVISLGNNVLSFSTYECQSGVGYINAEINVYGSFSKIRAGLFHVGDITIPVDGYDFEELFIQQGTVPGGGKYEKQNVPAGTYALCYEIFNSSNELLKKDFFIVTTKETTWEYDGIVFYNEEIIDCEIAFDLGDYGQFKPGITLQTHVNEYETYILPTKDDIICTNNEYTFDGWYIDNRLVFSFRPDYDSESYTTIKARYSSSAVEPTETSVENLDNILSSQDSSIIKPIKITDADPDFETLKQTIQNNSVLLILDLSACTECTSIPQEAFKELPQLISITLPNTITRIETYAFYGCSSLKMITLPNNLEIIDSGAFYDCSALKTIELPDSVITLDEKAFSYCKSLTKVTLGNGISSISSQLFNECNALTKVTMGNHITSIEETAFGNCYSLAEINIPNSVTEIGCEAFSYCTNLTKVTLPNNITSLPEGLFSYCEKLTQITIPPSVTSIGSSCFSNCTGLTEITIPDSVLDIDDYLFYACSNLKKITLSKNITSIPEYLCSYCSQLSQIEIPAGVTSIGYGAFCKCINLKQITIPDSVTTIDKTVFQECTQLQSVTLSKNLTVIPYYSFMDCSSLESIEIPDSVTSIENYVFISCTNLQEVKFPKNLNSISEDNFTNCPKLKTFSISPENEKYGVSSDGKSFYPKDTKTLLWCCDTGSVVIPDGIEVLNGDFFTNPDKISTLVISEGVKTIKESSIRYCSKLSEVTIPASVEYIEYYAFYNSNNIQKITFTDPNNWYYTDDFLAYINKENGTLQDLSNSTENASLFTDSGESYYWYHITGTNE